VAGKRVPDWRVLIPVLISPAALSCLISGQGSVLTATASSCLLAYDLLPLTFAAGRLSPLQNVMPPSGVWCNWCSGPLLCSLRLGSITCPVLR
jgi:hypothetical protein